MEEIKKDNTIAGINLNEPVEPLVREQLTFENIMNNPILKPIAETNNSMKDLEEMNFKKLTEILRDEKWINEALDDLPVYQESAFISRFLKMYKNTSDVMKIQDLEIKSLKNTIKEMLEIVKRQYGVLVEEEQYRESSKTKEPEMDYKAYLKSLINSGNEIAESILKIYEGLKHEKTEYDRFSNACTIYYKDEVDKEKRLIAAQILRRELKGGENG